MKRAKQVTVYCPDMPGVLSHMAWALWGNRVSILAFQADIADGVVRIRLTVDKPELARRVFHQLGWDSTPGEWPQSDHGLTKSGSSASSVTGEELSVEFTALR